MIWKRVKVLFVFIFSITMNGIAQDYQKTDLGIKAIVNSVAIELQFYNSSTVRVLKYPEDKTVTKKSLSVVLVPE